MIVEQFRYYADEEQREQILAARRAISRVRSQLGLPSGHILVADPAPEDGPFMIWQCSYEDEVTMAVAEATLAGSADYAAARDQLGRLTKRIEFEIYTADEEKEEQPTDPSAQRAGSQADVQR
jgi:hypothetical protein